MRAGDQVGLTHLLAAGAGALPSLARFEIPAGGEAVVTVPPPEDR